MPKYHVLFVKYEPEDDWAIEFGDYDKSVVVEEFKELRGVYRKRVVTVEGDAEADVTAMQDKMNREWREAVR